MPRRSSAFTHCLFHGVTPRSVRNAADPLGNGVSAKAEYSQQTETCDQQTSCTFLPVAAVADPGFDPSKTSFNLTESVIDLFEPGIYFVEARIHLVESRVYIYLEPSQTIVKAVDTLNNRHGSFVDPRQLGLHVM